MRKLGITVVAASVLLGIAGYSAARPDMVIRVATGDISHTLCSATFVSALDPDRVYEDELRPEPGMWLIDWAVRYQIDRQRRQVTANVAGMFASHAVYRDGTGCILVHGADQGDRAPPASAFADRDEAAPLLPEIGGPDVVAPADARLRAALDRAFAEPDHPPYRRTKAVVVVHDGRVIAERYAPGYGVDTPMLGNSATKSVTSALIGILVRQGRLSAEESAVVPAPATPFDPRHAITIDELLRMTSGLAQDERHGGSDPALRMWFLESDMTSFAESEALDASPGSHWGYSDGGYQILSRLIRDRVGGHAEDVLSFADRELFAPLGMHHVTLEFDATGTPIGSKYMLAPARDWARFGMLYLDDGVVGSRRILPEGWVRYSASKTLETGYGAGFWTNLGTGDVPYWGVPWGLVGVPRDAFFARGYLGQYVVVVPSERLVLVRFGMARNGGDTEGVARLIADVIAALSHS